MGIRSQNKFQTKRVTVKRVKCKNLSEERKTLKKDNYNTKKHAKKDNYNTISVFLSALGLSFSFRAYKVLIHSLVFFRH